jgi:translation initiation factor 2 subunit 1
MCTVTKVFAHGAFAKLDEYQDKDGFIHISEVASTWIKNIRDFVKEGQKVVAKVLSVDEAKGHIDLSMLEIASKEIKKTLKQAYKEVGFPLEEKYGETYTGLEELTISGADALKGLDIPEVWAKPLIKVANENIVLPNVNITGYLDLTCTLPNGIDLIKESLIFARDLDYGKDINVETKYLKSPRFSVKVTAPEYREAEEALKSVTDRAIEKIKELGGEGTFNREQK